MALDAETSMLAATAKKWLGGWGVPVDDNVYLGWRNRAGYSLLHLACSAGHYKTCEYLLRLGHPLTVELPAGINPTPFMLAIRRGRVRFVRWMVETINELGLNKAAGPIQFACNTRGTTAMMFACLSGSIEMADFVLQLCGRDFLFRRDLAGASLPMYTAINSNVRMMKWIASQMPDSEFEALCTRKSLLMEYAAGNGKHGMLRHLVETPRYGCPPMVEFGATIVSNAIRTEATIVLEYVHDKLGAQWLLDLNYDGVPSFLMAAEKGKLRVLRWFRKKWPDVAQTAVDTVGCNAFMRAANFGRLRVLQWLKVECGLDPRIQTAQKFNAAMTAAAGGHRHVIEWLASVDCPLSHGDSDYDIGTAASENGSVELVEWVYDKYSHLLKPIANNEHVHRANAGIRGHLGLLKWLYARGHVSKDNATHVAYYACQKDHVAIISWLIEVFGLETVYQPVKNESQFWHACNNRAFKIMSLYLSEGCVPRSRLVVHALQAVVSGSVGALKVLKVHGLSITARNYFESSLVITAIRHGKLDCLKWLLTQGCPLSEKDYRGMTTLECAIEGGNEEIISFLKEAMGIVE
jgi:ankyrin repeat protein